MICGNSINKSSEQMMSIIFFKILCSLVKNRIWILNIVQQKLSVLFCVVNKIIFLQYFVRIMDNIVNKLPLIMGKHIMFKAFHTRSLKRHENVMTYAYCTFHQQCPFFVICSEELATKNIETFLEHPTALKENPKKLWMWNKLLYKNH